MTSIRCSQCSLVNFTTASTCKRCGTPLAIEEMTDWETNPHNHDTAYTPPTDGWSSVQTQLPPQTYYASTHPVSDSRSKKTIGIVVIAILCVVAVISIPLYLKSGKAMDSVSYNWRDYSPDDVSFSISMPGEPKHATMGRGGLQMHMTTVELGKHNAFAVMYADLPPAAMNLPVDRIFDAALESMKRRQEMIVLSRKEISLEGHTGMELGLKPPASAGAVGTGVCRIYWIPPRLYIIAAGGPDSPEQSAAKTRFLDSFKLLKK